MLNFQRFIKMTTTIAVCILLLLPWIGTSWGFQPLVVTRGNSETQRGMTRFMIPIANKIFSENSVSKSNDSSSTQVSLLSSTNNELNQMKKSFQNTLATMMLSSLFVIGFIQPAYGSDRAAQITFEKIPPAAISIQIQDLPVIGKVLSGVYTKVPDNVASQVLQTGSTIVIQSPKDKVGAVADIAKGGHLEFDVNGGKLINTHFDIDIAADEAGKMKVLIQSNIIPPLPFKNMASTAFATTANTSGKESTWNIVTNMGNGESYYYNAKTGVTQLERPTKI